MLRSFYSKNNQDFDFLICIHLEKLIFQKQLVFSLFNPIFSYVDCNCGASSEEMMCDLRWTTQFYTRLC